MSHQLIKPSLKENGITLDVELFEDELGYKVGNLPSSYLGMPLGAHYKSKVVWDEVEERFRKRLAFWEKVAYI